MVQMRHVAERKVSTHDTGEKVDVLPVSAPAAIGPSLSYNSFGDGGGEIMFQIFHALRNREEGQTLVEYALILAFVSILSITALTALSDGINGVFETVVGAL